MPAVVGQPETSTSISWPLQIAAALEHPTESISTYAVRLQSQIRSENSKTNCKGYKLRGIDTGPCGNSIVNYASIALIIFVVSSLCFALYMKTFRPKPTTSADARSQPVINPYQALDLERQKREQRERAVQQHLQDERRRQNIPARAVTDVSSQQGQLAERLNQLQEQLGSALRERERRDQEALANGSGPLAPEAAHLRARERHWERYQLRSVEDITAWLECADPLLQAMRSDGDESTLPRTSGRGGRRGSEPLPEYAIEDPLASQPTASSQAP
ncbi:MAG: hypothetical protein Q9219_006404 [cf. Caloplaca sp. 3 TL-2023]